MGEEGEGSGLERTVEQRCPVLQYRLAHHPRYPPPASLGQRQAHKRTKGAGKAPGGGKAPGVLDDEPFRDFEVVHGILGFHWHVPAGNRKAPSAAGQGLSSS